MKKICCGCKLELSLDSFKSNKNRKDGLQTQCIQCQKIYRRNHYLNNRRKYINKSSSRRKEFQKWWQEYKSNYSCSECGESHVSCIQFHHVDDNKEGAVSELVNKTSKKIILKELSKCVPLCANCHCKLHWKERYPDE